MSAPPQGAESAPPRRAVALARRAGWSLTDQALSSLSNLVLSFLVAGAVDEEAFGAFTVSFTVYSMAVLISRSLSTAPLAMRFAAVEAAPFRVAAGMSSGTAAAVGLGMGLVVLVPGLALGGDVGVALLAMAFLLPGLLVQDAWRMAFFAQGQPQWAAALDGAWTVLQIGGVAALLAVGTDSAVPFVIAWGSAGAAAAGLGVYRGGTVPRIASTWSWLRAHWDITGYLVAESLLLQGAYQGALLLVGAFGGLADAGALRGAQVLIGPVSLLAASMMAFGVPEIARRPWLASRQRLMIAAGAGGVLALAGLAWGVVALLLPDRVGVALLGDSWDGVRVVLLASVVGQVGNLLSCGPAVVVYGMGKAASVFRVHATISVLLVVLGIGGLQVGGAEGAAWGFALAYWLVVPYWFWTVHRVSRDHAASSASDPVGMPAAEAL